MQLHRRNAADAPAKARFSPADPAEPAAVGRTAAAGGSGTGPGTLRITRSKGLPAGLLLVPLGIWGAIVPFVGPYFGYGIGHTGTWYFTYGRLWLDVLPGVAVLLGGLALIVSRNRAVASAGAWLALAGGIWFVVGAAISRLWTVSGLPAAGLVTGSVGHQVALSMGYFAGLGAVVSVLAGIAAGRLTVRGVRDVRTALADRAR